MGRAPLIAAAIVGFALLACYGPLIAECAARGGESCIGAAWWLLSSGLPVSVVLLAVGAPGPLLLAIVVIADGGSS